MRHVGAVRDRLLPCAYVLVLGHRGNHDVGAFPSLEPPWCYNGWGIATHDHCCGRHLDGGLPRGEEHLLDERTGLGQHDSHIPLLSDSDAEATEATTYIAALGRLIVDLKEQRPASVRATTPYESLQAYRVFFVTLGF